MPSRTKKFRGYRTHGRGKKSGRGAGIIGGHGKAGYGKTGKIGMLKFDPNYFGRHGFKRPQCMVEANRTINVGELSEQIERFVSPRRRAMCTASTSPRRASTNCWEPATSTRP